MEPRRRKRGFAASAAEKIKARQATLLRWQKLLAITLEYIYSLRWAQKEMVQALAKAHGERDDGQRHPNYKQDSTR